MGDFTLMPIFPVLSLTTYGLLALLLTPWHRYTSRWLGLVCLVGLATTFVGLVQLWSQWRVAGPLETAAGMVRVDGLGLFFSFILLLIGTLTVLYSMTFLEREEADQGEFYALILLCLAGMMMMIHTTHLIMVLVGLEVFSLSLYVLCGLTRLRVRSVESALKYFLLGAFSSGFMVYGMALLYGATGSLDLARIGAEAAAGPSRMLWVGMGLVLIGLAFKIAIVPFHQWVPDVYQGAPTNITGFMAAATKTAAFAVLLRFLIGAFGQFSDVWEPMIIWMSILTMTVANLVALAQTNLKRLLAFSSIAHAGYLLIAVVCRPDDGVGAILFYLTSYAFMTIGAFAVLAAAGRGDAEARTRLRVLRLGPPGLEAADARPGDGVLPLFAGRHAADRGLPRQVRDLPGRDQVRALRARGDRHAERRRGGVLLHPRRRDPVLPRGRDGRAAAARHPRHCRGHRLLGDRRAVPRHRPRPPARAGARAGVGADLTGSASETPPADRPLAISPP